MRSGWIAALAVAAAPLQAQPTTSLFDSVSENHEVDDTTQAEDVRLREDHHDRMTVAVRLAGAGPFQFLVDTGADRTAVSSDVAAQLGLKVGDLAALHSVTGIKSVRTATVPNLQWSSGIMRIVDAPILEAQHMGADGILGTDSLRSKRVVFDFEKRIMTIVPSEQRVSDDKEAIIVTGRLRNGRLILTNAVADDRSITVILDTGSEVSVGNEPLRRRLASGGSSRKGGIVKLESVTGDFLMGEYAYVEKLDLGKVELSNLAIVFADAHTFKQLGLDKRPALLLGMNALRAFKKVSIDFSKRKLRLLLPETGSLDPVLLAAR